MIFPRLIFSCSFIHWIVQKTVKNLLKEKIKVFYNTISSTLLFKTIWSGSKVMGVHEKSNQCIKHQPTNNYNNWPHFLFFLLFVNSNANMRYWLDILCLSEYTHINRITVVFHLFPTIPYQYSSKHWPVRDSKKTRLLG